MPANCQGIGASYETMPEVRSSASGEPAEAHPPRNASSSASPTLAALAWSLLSLGAVAFGGLGAALALLQRRLVDQRGWLRSRDITDALAFTKPLPGSTVVQVTAFLAWRLRGWRGAALGSIAFIAPAATLMIAAAAASAQLPDAPWVSGALTGIQVAVTGLLVAAMWRLARGEARGRLLAGVLAAGFILGLVVNAALVVVGLGLVGALVGKTEADDG